MESISPQKTKKIVWGIYISLASILVGKVKPRCYSGLGGIVHMEKMKLGFAEFIATVDNENRDFVTELHRDFMANGCKIEVKEAKSGYLVSYVLNRKTVANYVFRKAGLMVRIYANHLSKYIDFLETLPEGMIKMIRGASICKRLINPDDCNPKCARGYDFFLQKEHFQKCRNNAFMFLLCKENNVFIQEFLCNELKACHLE